jgi:hypothetical protein
MATTTVDVEEKDGDDGVSELGVLSASASSAATAALVLTSTCGRQAHNGVGFSEGTEGRF